MELMAVPAGSSTGLDSICRLCGCTPFWGRFQVKRFERLFLFLCATLSPLNVLCQQNAACSSQDFVTLGQDIAKIRIEAEAQGLTHDQVNDFVKGYAVALLHTKTACAQTDSSPTPAKSKSVAPHATVNQQVAGSEQNAASQPASKAGASTSKPRLAAPGSAVQSANTARPTKDSTAQDQPTAAPVQVAATQTSGTDNNVAAAAQGQGQAGQDPQPAQNASNDTSSTPPKTKPTFDFTPVVGDQVVEVTAKPSTPSTGIVVALYNLPTQATACDGTTVPVTLKKLGSSQQASTFQPTDAYGKVTFQLASPVPYGTILCAYQQAASGPWSDAAVEQGSDGVRAQDLQRPIITSGLTGASSVTVSAMPTDDKGKDEILLTSAYTHEDCHNGQGARLTAASGTGNSNPKATESNGQVTINLAAPLSSDMVVCATQQYTPANSPATSLTAKNSTSEPNQGLDWGRVRAYVAGGVLLANNPNPFNQTSGNTDNGQFTSAHLFANFTMDSAWALPGCYLLAPGKKTASAEACLPNPHKKSKWIPGLNTYVEAELTAIQVASTATSNGILTVQNSDTAAFFSNQKTARIGSGIYLPWLVTRWTFAKQPDALFVAPIFNFGWDTLPGPTQQTAPLPSGGTITPNLNQVYNYFNYGSRFGLYRMEKNSNRAPETISFVDLTLGKYSNLPSYHCVPETAVYQRLINSTCASGFGDSQFRPWRFGVKGSMKIPYTPAFVGVSANISGLGLNHHTLDKGAQPPDELRFIIGFESDLASIIQKIKGSTPQ